jgi:hypothetical protein
VYILVEEMFISPRNSLLRTMYKKLTIGMAVIMAGIALSTVSTSAVFAQPPQNPSGFGDAASNFLAKDRQMGTHSQAGSAAGDPPFNDPSTGALDTKPGRNGIGTLPGLLGLDHVSHIPGFLCSPPTPPDDSRCN